MCTTCGPHQVYVGRVSLLHLDVKHERAWIRTLKPEALDHSQHCSDFLDVHAYLASGLPSSPSHLRSLSPDMHRTRALLLSPLQPLLESGPVQHS